MGAIANRRRRMQAWLGGHRGAFGRIALTVLVLACASLSPIVDNSVVGYLPLLAVLSCLVFMLVHLLVASHCIKYGQTGVKGDCRRGESVDFVVEVTNGSFVPVTRIDLYLYLSDLFGEVDSLTKYSFSLLPKETKEFRLAIRFDHIGEYRAGLHSIVVHDLVGLFERRIASREDGRVLVMPRIIPLSRIAVVEELALDNQRSLDAVINDGMDYAGIREYVVGDPFKAIHWKATARFDNYLTRLYETQINPGICVVLDACTSWNGLERVTQAYDAVIEAALSVDAYARDNGFDHTILLPDADGGFTRLFAGDYADYADVVRRVPHLTTADAGVSGSELIREGVKGRYASGNVVVCSADLSDDLLSAIIDLKGAGKRPMLLLACPEDLTEEEKRYCARMLSGLAMAQIPFLSFTDAEELQGGMR